MSKFDDVLFLDATAQAQLVRQKEIQSIELIEAAIARIEKLNPALNAVITPMFDEARRVARSGVVEGPLAGVPFLLKDLLASYAGVRLTAGSALLSDFVPDHDGELVTRLKRAGLIILGKTNTPEFGILPTTEPLFLGASRNPWDTRRTPGGSSGGSAAAVAAGMVAMAHGNDGGGSIRIPASCCGLFGLKPTRARNPLGPDLGDLMSGLVAEHALTRSVRDSAALLDATAGPDLGDPYWAPPPVRPFLDEVKTDPGRLRIAYTTTAPSGAPVHADCVKATQDAANLCADLGHDVVEASPAIPGDLMSPWFVTVYASGCAAAVDFAAHLTGKTPAAEKVEPLTWAIYEMGRKYSAPEYMGAIMGLQCMAREIARFFVNHDVWLTPTLGEPPVPLGTFDSPAEEPLLGLFRSGLFAPFTPMANFTGQPAMSVPLYWNDEGLPIGAHFIGRFGDEATLFRLAGQLERARPWAMRRPPLTI
ncbi:MAG: amidase [Acidobacteria bacterium]|nr:amidase [Acidobacteriota bacterium]MBI3656341.1 amidase [Acidobacteriota bacterium]